ncbi:SDR family NAD(P)-dependent oxidoreductase [Frigoribacterium sp. CG_9.8]|uniref:SDR family NAD(P)-dependent oxidoreductase n=1 Tax=Frigoribacterium sp. CG_9.8 TaxID=2787733 RepID=UPI0018C9454C|nr:SDR family NAD(P)-dependent oxidoreductase [Frigoribacterium sp. CG_9.8]MBG6108362.1 NAD(P)-dependent dehydrogenase (short-subunit alcohol dehydrogenase family) [Frigoribacterium sp. CG_9.8]
MHITDTVAIVTGGASGLGLATTRALTAAGAHVVILDLVAPTEPLEDTTSLTADVTSEADVAAAVARATQLGTLRILINCAGIAPANRVVGRDGPVALELFERAIRINLIGSFNVLRLAAAAMQQNEPIDGERGVIVNTASVAAFDGQIGQAAYSASKGAIAAMTLPIAREFAATLIRVMTIAPGIFETPMMAAMSEETRLSLGSQVPHPARLGLPAEYAALVRHIVENPYLNGETIRLDGAIRMMPR